MAKCIIITGERNSGKTTSASLLCRREGRIRGFLSLSEGNKDEITLLDLDNGNRLPLMSMYFDSGKRIGRYSYLESSFDYALAKKFSDGDIVLLDEVGRLECSGKGFHDLIREIMNLDIHLILTVRAEFLSFVISYFKLSDVIVFSVGEQDMLSKIEKSLNP